MNKFRDSLKATIEAINARYQEADADLHEVVVELSNEVESISSGSARLSLDVCTESAQAIIYSLSLSGDVVKNAFIAYFKVSSSGYPIGASLTDTSSFGKISNRVELEDFLKEMATNPDSRLVTLLAFETRRHSQPDPLQI